MGTSRTAGHKGSRVELSSRMAMVGRGLAADRLTRSRKHLDASGLDNICLLNSQEGRRGTRGDSNHAGPRGNRLWGPKGSICQRVRRTLVSERTKREEGGKI